MEVFEKIISKINEKIEHYDSRHKILTDAGMLSDADRIADRMSELDFAREIVKQTAAEYNDGWILCSERLPEKKGKYLTTSKIYFVPDHVDEPDNYIGLEITYYSEINGWNGEVIAWQPLPAPYQPKGE